MTKKKRNDYHVRTPSHDGNGWVVEVASDVSPRSEVIETIYGGSSYRAAFKTYQHLKKEVGDWV
tara:strand:+ start:250 stop:441 length:192 start_codon:yes stop_codon:yes gene_type:complete